MGLSRHKKWGVWKIFFTMLGVSLLTTCVGICIRGDDPLPPTPVPPADMYRDSRLYMKDDGWTNNVVVRPIKHVPSLNNTVTVKTVKGRGRCSEYEIRISEEDLENLLIDNGVDSEVIDEIMDEVK